MSKGIIELREVLEAMKQCDRNGFAKPFSIVFDTFNHQENKAGDRFEIPKAVMCMANKSLTRVKSYKQDELQKKRSRKDPHHFINATRNIQPIGGGQVRTVNIWLIAEFNGLEVIWHRHG